MRSLPSFLAASFTALVAFAWGVPAQADILLVSDTGGNQILAYNASLTTSTPTTFVSSVTAPLGLAYGPDNNLYVSSGNTILKFNGTSGALIGTYATLTGAFATGTFHDLLFDSAGNIFATVDVPNGSKFDGHVVKIAPGGGSVSTAIFNTGAKVSVEGLTLGANGNLFVVTADNAGNNSNLLFQITTAGTQVGSAIVLPGVSFDVTTQPVSGDLFVAIRTGNMNNTVQQYTEAGTAVGTYATGFSQPQGVIFDTGLNLFVDQSNTPSVLRVPPGGGVGVTFSAGTQPNNPTYMTFQPAGIPEPGLLALLSMAGVALTAYGWRCRKSAI